MVDGEKVTYWLKVVAGYLVVGYVLAYFFGSTSANWLAMLVFVTVAFFVIRWLASPTKKKNA